MNEDTNMNKHALPMTLAAIAAVAVAAAAPSRAEAAQCGYSQPSWNVPKGGAVFTQGDGPIKAVLNGVGETRTHTMLYLGGGRVAHTSMYKPGQRSVYDDGFCGAPVEVEQLTRGWPGTERMDVSAAYQYLDGNTTAVYYQRGKVFGAGTSIETDWGAAIADTVSGFPGDFVSTAATTSSHVGYFYWFQHYVEALHNYGASRPHSPYSLFQYRNAAGVSHGYEAWDTGLVCSTFLAYGQHAYGKGGAGFGVPYDVSEHQYTHDQTVAAGYALYDSVKSECEGEHGFWATAGLAALSSLWCGDTSLCDEAGGQVRNCMAYGSCADGNPDRFDGDASYPFFTASSISPDWIGGWVAGQNYSAPDQSVWAWDGNHQVTFSGTGNVYDCWY